MRKKKENITTSNAERYNPSFSTGLNKFQVQERIEHRLTNKVRRAVGKSYWEIFRTNVLSFFNILLFIIAALIIYGGYYNELFFLCILIPNIIIGLYEDIKARLTLNKLRLVTQPKCVVIRDSQSIEIGVNDIVLDDVVSVEIGGQMCIDGIILNGSVLVDESVITGESKPINKTVGDILYSGSIIVGGSCFARADKIGKDSYSGTLQNKANQFARSPSQILKSLRNLFRVIGSIVISFALITIIVFGIQGSFSSSDDFIKSIAPIAGSMVGMIPSGLFLLTSMALAVSVVSLAKKKVQIQDFYSVEMMARTDTLCVDKTGTVTDGKITLTKVISLSNKADRELAQIISDVLCATGDTNATAKALKEKFHYDLSKVITGVLPFNSSNKYSAASFKGGKTYIMGAIEFINIINKSGIIKRAEEFASRGYRVMVLAETSQPIIDGSVQGECEAIALIVLQDHIRPDAIETFKWFKENGVDIKVISGDNAVTVSEIARQAGIAGAEKYISLEGMSNEEIKLIVNNYSVFGRVSPEQKETIVMALKENGKTVAMTGDGVNDILALKRADCSIAVNSGSDAAKSVSHIILMEDNFDSIPGVVAEGRKVVNNIQRTASLYLTKTVFVMFFSFIFLFFSIVLADKTIRYPFTPSNMYLWEIFSLGLATFFLALEPNKEIMRGNFLGNVLKKLLPASLAIIIPVAAVFVLQELQRNNFYTGVYPDLINSYQYGYSSNIAHAMAVIVLSIMSVVVLFKTCSPFSKYRKVIFSIFAFLLLASLVGAGFYTYTTGKENILGIDYLSLAPVNYVAIGAIVIISTALYLFILYIIEVAKGEVKLDENK